MLNIQQRLRVVVPIVLVLGSFAASVGAAAAAVEHPLPPSNLNCNPIINFNAANFDRSTKIDNPFLPLKPGTQITLLGQAGGEPHKVVFTVTDLVKRIDGVRTLTIWDRDFSGPNLDLAEDELAFFAQDRAGNVWNLGEYPEEIDNGKVTGAPNTWISGQNATGGIHMLANPSLGTPRYLQGFSPDIDFLDCAQVFAKTRSACMPGLPAMCLVTDETSPLDPDHPNAHQRKFHSPGVGIVKINAADDPEGEFLALTTLTQLDAAGLADAQRAALQLDRRGHAQNAVYRTTTLAIPCTPGTAKLGDCPDL